MDNKDYLYKVITYILKDLSSIDNNSRISELSETYYGVEIKDKELAVIYMISIFLTHYPFFKGKLSSLNWSIEKVFEHFYAKDPYDNMIYNDNGYIPLLAISDEEIDYNYQIDELLNNNPNYYVSRGRVYTEDPLDIINKERDVWERNLNSYDLSPDEEIEQIDEKVIKEINKKIITGGKINVKMLYQFIRNGFAHHTWKYNDGSIYIYHLDDVTKETDLNLNMNSESFLSLLNEYIDLLFITSDKSSFGIIYDLLEYDIDKLVDLYGNRDILKLFEEDIKNTPYYEDFMNNHKNFESNGLYDTYIINKRNVIFEYIKKYGHMTNEDLLLFEKVFKENEYYFDDVFSIRHDLDCFNIKVNRVGFIIEKILDDNPSMENFICDYKKQLLLKLKQYIGDKDYFNENHIKRHDVILMMQEVNKLLYENEIAYTNRYMYLVEEFNNQGRLIANITGLLNAIFVQNDFYDIDLSTIDFSKLVLNDEYVNLIKENYIRKQNSVNTELETNLNKFYRAYYTAESRKLSGSKKAPILESLASDKKDNYNNYVITKFEELNKKSINTKKILNKENKLDIMEHIRNSLSHGNLNIVIYYPNQIDSIDLVIRDYDEAGCLSFSGTIKFIDLLENVLNLDIVNQLFNTKNELSVIKN